MSSDPRSAAPSREPDASAIAALGAPLLEALEARHPGARRHADGTASWALAIAAQLRLDPARSLAIRETARLHEVGRVYVELPLAARSETELSDVERQTLDGQAAIAAQLAEGACLPPAPCAWLEHWRERMDGSGPKRLSGAEIPVEARIIRAACRFDTALADSAGDADRALASAGELAGEVDPAIVRALAAIVAPAGDGKRKGGDMAPRDGGRGARTRRRSGSR